MGLLNKHCYFEGKAGEMTIAVVVCSLDWFFFKMGTFFFRQRPGHRHQDFICQLQFLTEHTPQLARCQQLADFPALLQSSALWPD